MNLTGLDMLKIDIANCYGLEKRTFEERLLWFEAQQDRLPELIRDAEEPLLMEKAIVALRATEAGKPVGHNMFLDATASGLQIMAALSGCKKTARHVNMLNTGDREDVYVEVATLMNKQLPAHEQVDRPLVKKPVMTHYYNKKNQDTLSEAQRAAFYSVLSESFEGAEAVKDVINMFWNNEALEHKWTLPDGHVARVLVTGMKTARIEVDELDHVTFSYRFEANEPSNMGTSLAPNIIHSIDGYIVREMIRRSRKEGFEMAHIFDAFTCHPNHMPRLMAMYREIMAEIADSTLLQDILSEISGEQLKLKKYSEDLSADILASEYMLS